MSNGLPRERKIVLYGLQFAAGSASLRPDSDATVKQVSALLHQHRKLKVYIVGHTDNSGLLEQNLVLSRQRAQAVELGCWTMACVLGTISRNGTPFSGWWREFVLIGDRGVKYHYVAKVLAAAQHNHMQKMGFVNTSEFKD